MAEDREDRSLPPSVWPAADLSAMGMAPASDLAGLSLAELQRNLNIGKNGQAFLDWSQFQYALAVYDRVAASVAAEKLESVERSVIDVYARAVLAVQTAMECTDYQGRMLLEDAFAARDRLPLCAQLLRVGRIDRRRFHKIVTETDLLIDEDEIALADQLIAAEIAGLRGRAGLSEAEAAAIARRRVFEIDPDAARRRRENAKAGRNVHCKSLEDGMGQLTVIATAEDIRLAVKSLDAYLGGLCPNDPRTKAVARSEAAIARMSGRPFCCQCEREDCTAVIGDVTLDPRIARIIVHAICDSSTLEGADKPGYLDGYGPISADHVRELAGRDDASVHHHDLNDLCEDTGDETAEPPPDDDVASGDRLPSRPVTPASRRGDTPWPDHEIGDQDRWLPADPELPADYGPPPGWFDDPEPGFDVAGADLDVLIAADPDHDDVQELLERALARPPAIDLDQLYREPQPEPVSDRVIAGTALPSDGYRPTTLTDLIARFLWGTCSIPGCERAAFSCDLDHVAEYDNLCPDQGGPTCLCNLLPKCRFHHLVKTHLDGFVDELWIDRDGTYRSAITTPGGVSVESIAPNQWLFPGLATLRCRHQLAGTTATGTATITDPDTIPARARTRTQNKHARRRAERNRNRRDRHTRLAAEKLEAERAHQAELDDLGEPPF